MPETFDIIVIGAGPAGLSATLRLLKSGQKPSVLLVDKAVPWERPVVCAEGVWCDPLREVVKVRPEWIRLYISNAVLHSPNGATVTYFAKDAGCILNRPAMQADLARQCAALGATARYDRRVIDIGEEENGRRAVRFGDGSIATAGVVIDASGPISPLGKREKISWKPADLEPAYFAVAENTGISTDSIHVYLGREIAPGGYAWAFPRDKTTANVGLAIGKACRGKVDIRKLLETFCAKTFPDAHILRHFAGAIPCETGPQTIAVSRLLKAGDAASTVNPVSRSGIVEAMVSGACAADFGLRMLSADSARQAASLCREYQKAWHEAIGKKHAKLSRVKGSLLKIPDSDYNRAFSALSAVPQDKLTTTKIIRLSLGRFPRLVWAMRHLM